MIDAMPVLSAGAGLHETLALLTAQLCPDAKHTEDLVFLRDVFSEKSLAYLMKIHEKLRQYEHLSPTPVLHSASSLAEDVAEELQSGPMSNDEKELLQLLTAPHLKAVLTVHDTVAQKSFDPVLPPLPDDLDDGLEEESVKIVRLVKNKEPLGATIRRDEATGSIVVARIMRGGAADRSGWFSKGTKRKPAHHQHQYQLRVGGNEAQQSCLVHVGDELREVNGILVIHKRPDEISQILSQSQGSISLKIIPAMKEEDRMKESKVYMRALFDYVPSEDKATPCQEAGLPFQRGDILHVVSQDDATWWQAKRVGDSNLRAGLIPSRQFQERRLAYRIKIGTLQNPKASKAPVYDQACDKEDCDCEGYFNGQYIAGLRRSFRLSRKDRHGESRPPESAEPEFLTYEEVMRDQRRHGDSPRLVVLIGYIGCILAELDQCHDSLHPKFILGRQVSQTGLAKTTSSLGARINELKQKVVAENPQRYGVAVPHTTRPKKSHEKEGVEYHFVSKQAFEADVQSNKFIEHGEYKENLYGTSLEAIRSVLARNKLCLVDVQPEALRILRMPEFRPYVIFVKPQIPEGQRRRSAATSPGQGDPGRVTDDLQEMRQSAQLIDQQYGHLVDRILVKEDSASACAELRIILERLEREPQWVPVSWVKT